MKVFSTPALLVGFLLCLFFSWKKCYVYYLMSIALYLKRTGGSANKCSQTDADCFFQTLSSHTDMLSFLKNNFFFSFWFFIFWPHLTWGILVPRPGIAPCLLQWKQGVLTTGPPGKSQDRRVCMCVCVCVRVCV